MCVSSLLVTFHGHTITVDGHRTVKDSVFPARSSTAHMTAWNPGKWLMRCLVTHHYRSGMTALFNVNPCPGKTVPEVKPVQGKTREYFLAAEETLWIMHRLEWTILMAGVLQVNMGECFVSLVK